MVSVIGSSHYVRSMSTYCRPVACTTPPVVIVSTNQSMRKNRTYHARLRLGRLRQREGKYGSECHNSGGLHGCCFSLRFVVKKFVVAVSVSVSVSLAPLTVEKDAYLYSSPRGHYMAARVGTASPMQRLIN